MKINKLNLFLHQHTETIFTGLKNFLFMVLLFSLFSLLPFLPSSLAAGLKYCTIVFDVLDIENGNPVPGTIIEITAPPLSGGQTGTVSRQETTGASGRAVFTDVPPFRKYNVFIAHSEYEIAKIPGADIMNNLIKNGTVPEQGQDYHHTIWVQKKASYMTGSITGFVISSVTNQKIPGISIAVKELQGTQVIKTHSTVSGQNGSFTFQSVRSGPVEIVASGSGYMNYLDRTFVPAGGSLNHTIVLGKAGGTINGAIMNPRLEPLGQVLIQVTRNGQSVAGTQVDMSLNQKQVPFTIPNVPVIPPGANYTYTVTALSGTATMTNPQGITGVVIRSPGQVVTVGPIYMTSLKGTLLVTLVHRDILSPGETEASLDTAAQNAIITVDGICTSCRFTGENPNHYYRYTVTGAPAGRRTIQLYFPNHTFWLSQGGQATVTIAPGGTSQILLNLQCR